VFARAAESTDVIIKSLENVVFLSMDCEKGEGPEIAKKFNVRGYPSFVMTNGDGEPVERWIGYEGPEKWTARVGAGILDTRTLAAKTTAFTDKPTTELALSLAYNAATDFDFATSVTYLKKARDLDPENATEYTGMILTNMYYGTRSQAFSLADVMAEADVVMAAKLSTAEDKVNVALLVNNLAASSGEPDKAIPYIKQGLAAGKGYEELAEDYAQLQISHALLVEKDLDKAVELKRASMPEGWQEDPGQLNNFAWWCFENNTNLEEAEALALHGVEIAVTDNDKANILDTAAEICSARGNCEDAIARIKEAIALSPDREYYKDQLAKFEKELAEKKG